MKIGLFHSSHIPFELFVIKPDPNHVLERRLELSTGVLNRNVKIALARPERCFPAHSTFTGKIRVVFDCGAKRRSLNEERLQGPDITSSLIFVVTRFRRESVVIMADIENIFHQVQVLPDDVDLLRFLSWPQGDLSQAPCEYRMKVHLFGATSSPSCANFALRKCPEDFGHEYKVEMVEKLQHCFYVDKHATEEEALILCHELMSLCAKGGFCLTKWHSNRSEVLMAIPEPRRAKDVGQLDQD